MPPRILLTGIPSHYTRLIKRAKGTTVIYSEDQPTPESKEAFIQELTNISNSGNYLIGEGALHALSPNATHIPFWHLWNGCGRRGALKKISTQFDVCVFTCANLLRNDLSADAEARVINDLNMPIVMLGIGIQRRDDLKCSLPAGTRALLDVLKTKEHYFLTRGEDAAGFLRDEGFSFIRPVGCPSVYFMPENTRKALARLGDVRVGKARTAFSGYLGHSPNSVADVNALASAEADACYVIQDEPLIFDMRIEPNGDGRVYNSASGEIIGKHSFKGGDLLQRPLRLYAFYDTNQWRAWISTMDFSFGRRFHGNVVALQAGVPSLMVAIDDRMREMLDFVGLPNIDKDLIDNSSNRAEVVADFISGLDVSELVDRYDERERGFRSTLQDVGIV